VNFLFDVQAYTFSQALGRALMHSLWEGAGVALLLGAALWLLRGRSPNARYAAACSALALMLILPALTAWALSGQAQDVETDEVSSLPAVPTLPAVIPQASARAAGKSLPTSAGENLITRPQLSEGRVRLWLPWLTLLWLAGVSVLSARTLGGLVYTRRLRRRGARPVVALWQERAEEISRRLRVGRPVKVLESVLVSVPTAIGWLRPVVLLPASAFTGLTPRQLETILAHELAHIRRHDYLFNLLQAAAETLLFYHPAAWWVSRRVRAERELVCDDLAVAATGDALTYARALTQMERLRKRAAPRLALAADGGQLRARVLRLVGAQPRRRGVSTFAVGLFFAAAFFTTVACTRAVLSQRDNENARASQPATADNAAAAPGAKDASGTTSETPPTAVASLIAEDNVAGEDLEVRRAAVQALGSHAGAVVVMNPKTGQVYAVVNQEWALRRGWVPASTMKLVTSLAGIGEHVFDPSEKVRVRGRAERLDLTDALAVSDNDYFKSLAARVGAERILDYAARLGLGEQTGINYEGESAGRLPAARSVASAARLGFGEDVEVTPVQLAVLVSALANGGTLVVPRVPRAPEEAAPFMAQTRRRLDIAPATLGQIIPGMLAAVGRGTAAGIKDPRLQIAGKTGTLTNKREGKGMGLFASYAPADDPRLTVVVLTSGAGENGAAAAQVAGSIYRALRGRL
jgi:beta-lactamase regulating signal transducer with metallopeptidase domain